jgi:hypothetical protein
MDKYKLTKHEIAIFGIMDIDSDFDAEFYAKQYPETNTYYIRQKAMASDTVRLYHHYLHHGQYNNPKYCKNQSQLITQYIGLDKNPPSVFDHVLYQKLYPDVYDYLKKNYVDNADL